MDCVPGTFPPKTVLFCVMSQYLPVGRAAEYPALNRRVRPSEVRAAQAYMRDLGLGGFCQEAGADDIGFLPAFDLTGV